ncbi:response regulator [Arthrobacter sp. CAU 1506]|uniref:PP2C family protein-serine/threonine phosphatase n=1 Tax=Arthrobacter sp. CAU 1506 TaxID=2560052 RepID=UPI0010AD67DF|nr:fused response regulator/phosphatase [Arthrobacter sp. CAU 1506]TJY69539.1 response regulator [Arthrobacter sp. CAU 1506]
MPAVPNNRRAVIVEDNADIRRLLVQIVSEQGFTVAEAETGRDGLELIRAGGADLITLDLNLPDLDGIEVCRQVRAFSDAYILMITARVEEVDRLSGLETGADDYISKPFSPRELQARIGALFRRPRSQPVDAVPGADQERAAEVQRSLLPGEPLRVQDYDMAGRCRPTRNVGGDFFDWCATDKGLQLTVADAMGKGMGAALIAATVRAVLRSSNRHADLNQAFAAASQALEWDLAQSSSFVTIFHARLDAGSGTVDYVDAGHGLGLHLYDGGLRRLPSGGPPVGAVPGSIWAAGSLLLAPGDSLLVLSDGLLDAFDSVDAAMDAVAGVATVRESPEEVCDAVLELAGTAVADDVTAVMLRRCPPEHTEGAQ